MLKTTIFIIGGLLLLGQAALGTDLYYQAPDPSVAGSWHTLGNWYYDSAMTSSATALPTTSDTVYSIRSAADIAGVDMVNDWPWLATLQMGPYYSWTKQVVNVTADANCNDMRFGGGTNCFSRVELNIQNNSTLNVGDDMVVARRDYDSCVVNIESGSTINVNDNYEAYGAYRGITNVSGTMIVGDNIEMDSSCGWAMPNYLGDLYYPLLGDSEQTHQFPGGGYPMDYAEWTLNILAGGYVEADAVTGWNLSGSVLPGGEIHLYDTGYMVLRGNQLSDSIAARNAGLIWGDDIPGGVLIQLINGDTYIGVPEPTTMLLLGVGAFGLIRRRKT